MLQEDFYKQYTEPSLSTLPPPLPKEIGPYRIKALHHTGGMSWLYIGIDPETQNNIAIKVLPSNHVKNKDVVERFLKESKLISLTDHPNIVKLYDEGTWEGGLYIAMEWIDGISLRRFLQDHRLSLKRSLEVVLQIAQGLRYLHMHGIIHRDLKPENILITDSGTIKVIDFGISQMSKEIPRNTLFQVSGTPNYMSPEQKEASGEASYVSDIYSLGVIAYELILGRLCFGVIQTSLLPKKLGRIIYKALALSKGERYQTVDAFIEDLSLYMQSPDLEKEKPRQDTVNELLEFFNQAALSLSPLSLRTLPFADIGMAKTPAMQSYGFYCELFPLHDGTYLFLLAKPLEASLYSFFPAFTIKGIVQSLLFHWTQEEQKRPFFTAFVSALQELMQADSLLHDVAISYLLLDPLANKRHFFHAGVGHLVHTHKKKTVFLPQEPSASLLSSPSFSLEESVENWEVGDLLVYHAFSQNIPRSLLPGTLSAQLQAEALLKEASKPSEPSPIFTIRRLL